MGTRWTSTSRSWISSAISRVKKFFWLPCFGLILPLAFFFFLFHADLVTRISLGSFSKIFSVKKFLVHKGEEKNDRNAWTISFSISRSFLLLTQNFLFAFIQVFRFAELKSWPVNDLNSSFPPLYTSWWHRRATSNQHLRALPPSHVYHHIEKLSLSIISKLFETIKETIGKSFSHLLESLD